MKVAGLFAGIGGFERGFERAGHEPVLFCEIDPAAQSVLAARFPGVDIKDDVRLMGRLPRDVDVVCAGFPCQDLSMAGGKSGISGKKSSVISSLFELLNARRAPTVVIENVYFMLHLDRGKAMDSLVREFERRKYSWAYRIINTAAFGLPHRRRRVYFVASKDLDPRSVLFASDRGTPGSTMPSVDAPIGFYWTEGRSGVGLMVDGIPPLKAGSSIGIPSAPAVLFPDGSVETPSIEACERLQGFPTGWTKPAVSVDKRSRWRLVGNAVSTPVAQWIGEKLFSCRNYVDADTCLLDSGAPWPNAAYNVGSGRTAISISEYPCRRKSKSIEEYRDANWKPLSERAAKGFLKRAREGNLKFPEGFLTAIESSVIDAGFGIAAE